MDFDKAHAMLSELVLYAGRKGCSVSLSEIAVQLGYAEDDVFAMFGVLETHGLLRTHGTEGSWQIDARFLADTLQKLVDENRLTAHAVKGETHYAPVDFYKPLVNP